MTEDNVIRRQGIVCVYDKELAAIGVWASVRHSNSPARVCTRKRLIIKFVSWPSCPVTVCVSSLNHKSGNGAMEWRVVVEIIARKVDKVVCGNRSFIRSEYYRDVAPRCLKNGAVRFCCINRDGWFW